MTPLRQLFLSIIFFPISFEIDIELLTNVLDIFQMKRPTIVDGSYSLKNVFVMKLFLQGHYVRVIQHVSQISFSSMASNIIVLVDNLNNFHEDYKSILDHKTNFIVVIVSDLNESTIENMKLSIDMEVYFITQPDKEAYEFYEINDVHVKSK